MEWDSDLWRWRREWERVLEELGAERVRGKTMAEGPRGVAESAESAAVD